MSRRIDINADMGEYATPEEQANEAALMAHLSSCSIACGGHAGDEKSIIVTARLAAEHGVYIGAHPSYPDRENFGRISMNIDLNILRRALMEQMRLFSETLASLNLPMHHLKLHGALYNDAAKHAGLAALAGDIVSKLPSEPKLVGPPNSELERAATKKNIPFWREGFVDRLYQPDGALTPRNRKGAVIRDLDARVDQGVRLATGQPIKTTGDAISLPVDTLCIHSDSAGSLETASALRAALEKNGVTVSVS